MSVINGEILKKNSLKLITGTSISQIIPLILAPILTRIYSPEEFGLFSFYISIISILSISACARYDLAIILPRNKSNSFQIFILCIKIALAFSIIIFFLLLFFSNFKPLNDYDVYLIFLIPMGVFFVASNRALYLLLNKNKKYENMSVSLIFQSGFGGVFQYLFSKYSMLFSKGLILGQLSGQLITMIYLFKCIIRNKMLVKSNYKRQIILAKRYIDFPKYSIPSATLLAISSNIPSIAFNIMLSASTAGFYMIVQKLIGKPMGVITKSIGDVFRESATVDFNNKNECVDIYIYTFKNLLKISLLPFIIFYLSAPLLFEFILGSDWKVAGEYAQILTPMFFLKFIANPLSSMYIIAERQKEDMIMQIIILLFVILIFLYSSEINIILYLISALYSIVYISVLARTYFFSKPKMKVKL